MGLTQPDLSAEFFGIPPRNFYAGCEVTGSRTCCWSCPLTLPERAIFRTPSPELLKRPGISPLVSGVFFACWFCRNAEPARDHGLGLVHAFAAQCRNQLGARAGAVLRA